MQTAIDLGLADAEPVLAAELNIADQGFVSVNGPCVLGQAPIARRCSIEARTTPGATMAARSFRPR